MNRRRWLAAIAVLLVVAAIVAYVGVGYTVADRFSRTERHPVDGPPDVPAATSYEDVTLTTSDDARLSGWFFPAKSDRAVILIHGRNANRLEWEGRNERIASFLIAAGYSVLMFDLRGHGNSGGDPKIGDRFTLGFLERRDVDAGVTFLRGRGYADQHVALLGISMGAASALGELTLDPNVGPVIIDSSFTDVAVELEEKLPSEAGVPGWFAPGVVIAFRLFFGIDPEAVRPIDIVRAHPERPFLFIHCDADELINVHHGRDLRTASANPASDLWIASGCLHPRASDDHPDEYRTRVLAFLAAQMH
ncbi:MAG TPA: alpha/beta fold hydrolase [Candidatus Limnocylindria bacterium]